MNDLVKRSDVIGLIRALQNECPGFGFFGNIAIERIMTIQKVDCCPVGDKDGGGDEP